MIRIAIIGTGGFAASHHGAVRAMESQGECRLVATCDPDAALLQTAREKWDLDSRGVQVYDDYRALLDAHAHELDVVTVPTPIPLHAEMHRACVERGIACYLEKPPTLDPDELEAMIAVDASAAKQTQVAFNFIGERVRQSLKARILSGAFGAVRRVTFLGVWPRANYYFTRNAWAGQLLSRDGRLLLDSCLANAMAHYVHNAVFWAGTQEQTAFAAPVSVEAELYRTHAIASYDTAFVRAVCDSGVELRLVGTHACAGKHYHWEQVECTGATLRYVTQGEYTITAPDGTVIARGETDRDDRLQANLREYFDYVRGEVARPLTRLTDSRPFVHLNDLLYVAAQAVIPVESEAVGEYRQVAGMQDACDVFARTGAFPSAQGISWGRSTGATACAADLVRTREVVRRLASDAGKVQSLFALTP